MRCYHIKLNLVVLITCLGQTLAGHCNCDKSIDTCENIHVCYNCAFEYLAKSCQESQVSVDKETCRTHLTSGSYKRALYTKAQEECILINNNCKPEYSATVDVVFMKTCDTGCANYTMRKYENAAVAGTDNNNYTTSDYLTFCQYNCLPPTQDCTVSFASGTCTVFPTNCGGSCLLTNSTCVDVYTVTCNTVGCPTLTGPPNGVVNMSAGTSPGAQAVYSCKEGYNLTGSSVVICNSDGQWSNPAPTCTTPVGCPTLSNPLNGDVNTSAGTSPGAQAVYSCMAGYNLTGSSVVICNSDGQWSNPAPTCTPLVGCPTLSDLPNGVVNTSTGTSPGAYAVYSCKAGYNLTGSSVVICNSDGQWSNPAPTCTPLNCQPLSGPIDGLVNYTSTLFGSRAIYECNTGFVLNGSNVSTCEYDGNWDNPTPSCTPIYCGILAEPEFGSVSYIETSNGTIATYNCDTGYNISEPISRSCLANGSWDLPEPKCVPVDCGPIPNLKNGTVDTSEGTTFGKTATFSCDEGFLLLQSSIRVCQKNSQWSGIMPSCKVPGENAKKKNLGKLFIMPCICYPNKTFEGLTEKEIIQQLIADMKIEPKDTKLAVSKLISKPDPRVSSKMIGSVAIVVLSIIGGLILCTDIMTIRARRRALEG